MSLEPLDDGLLIAFGRDGIAQHLVVAAGAQCIHDKDRSAEVHIGHPHGGQVVATEKQLQCIVFDACGVLARDDFVKVVFFQEWVCFFSEDSE